MSDQFQPPPYPGHPAWPAQYVPGPPPAPRNGIAVASLVLGICSVVFCFAGIGTLAMVVLAIVFGAMRVHTSGMAVAGLILGSLGAVVYLIIGVASAGVLFLI